MRTQSCLRCFRGTLSATGAFWVCSACGLAITHRALKFEQERAGIARADTEGSQHDNQTTRPATQGIEKSAQAAKRIS